MDFLEKKTINIKKNHSEGLIYEKSLTNILSNSQDTKRTSANRYYFIQFHPTYDILLVSDNKNNIYLTDLKNEFEWNLNLHTNITAVSFVPHINYLILTAIPSGSLILTDARTGDKIETLNGHKNSIKSISFGEDLKFLTTSNEEVILWDLNSLSIIYEFEFRERLEIKFALILPITNNILICFDNDEIHLWKYESFAPIKKFKSDTWNGKLITSISITKNGRNLAVAGKCTNLAIINTDTWNFEKIINLLDVNILSVKQIQFISSPFDGGANKILTILSGRSILHFFDLGTNQNFAYSSFKKFPINKFSTSANGKYLAFIENDGNFKIHLTNKLLHFVKKEKGQPNQVVNKRPLSKLNFLKEVLPIEDDSLLNRNNLLPLLKEFGEYPTKYRSIIWKEALLQLPKNYENYKSLVNRGCHSAYEDINQMFPLENKILLKNLQKLMSLLAHWSPLFSAIENLQFFVFPFVKVFSNDPFACFEAVVTIIINYCQQWFQYYPFPPINILNIIDTILQDREIELYQHFEKNKITVDISWILLQTAFSEVLVQNDWYKFWDHVLTNQPWFLIIAVVAYISAIKHSLFDCRTLKEFKKYFNEPVAINMKCFLNKCYDFLELVDGSIHPKIYLKPFQPLKVGTYPTFDEYPKNIVDAAKEKLDQIRAEEKRLLEEELNCVEKKFDQVQKFKELINHNLEETRLAQLQDIYKEKLLIREHHLKERRNHLRKIQNEIYDKELKLIEETHRLILYKHKSYKNTKLSALENCLDKLEASIKANHEFDEIGEIERNIKEHDTRIKQIIDLQNAIINLKEEKMENIVDSENTDENITPFLQEDDTSVQNSDRKHVTYNDLKEIHDVLDQLENRIHIAYEKNKHLNDPRLFQEIQNEIDLLQTEIEFLFKEFNKSIN